MKNVLCITVIVLFANLCKIKALTLLVNGQPKGNGSTCQFEASTTIRINVTCNYDFINFKRHPPNLTKVSSSGTKINDLKVSKPELNRNNVPFINYEVPSIEKRNAHIYRCTMSTQPYEYVEVKLDYSSTVSTGGNAASFSGLNPLIYTISAVILLGTLAIVAITTCWIRARRSFHGRLFRQNNTPQDYFDYITDNEFTPLTTSEFAASLQERPPTYIESERLEQNVGSDEDASNSGNRLSPIPLPPRPQNLSSLSRLRVVQFENISSRIHSGHNNVTVHENESLMGNAENSSTSALEPDNSTPVSGRSDQSQPMLDIDDDP